MTTIDYAPLDQPISSGEVDAFTAAVQASQTPADERAARRITRSMTRHAKWKDWLRLSRLAAANGFTFTPLALGPGYPGSLFHAGDNGTRERFEIFHRAGGPTLDIGGFRYAFGVKPKQPRRGPRKRGLLGMEHERDLFTLDLTDHDGTTVEWGFMAVKLDRKLPNIVLAKKLQGIQTVLGTDLPFELAASQKLSLEGTFGNYFTLYCPKDYERDALYIFTPDLMALLIDQVVNLDVEIIDDWLFFYSNKRFDLADRATLDRLLTIADVVGAKTLDQIDHYQDDRAATPNGKVAPQGRRLKSGVSIIGVVMLVAALGTWIAHALGAF